MTTKKGIAGLACAGLVLLGGTGCSTRSASSAPADGRAADQPVTVQAVLPRRTTLRRTTTQPATIEAWYVAELHTKVAGYLKELRADIGQSVEAGEVLGVIDVPEMAKARERQEAMVRQLQADEKRAKAAVALAEANVRAAEAASSQARASIAMADAQLAADQAEFHRVEELVSNRAVAGRLLDEARKKLDSSRAAKMAAEAALEAAQANVAVAQQELSVAGADWEAARAQTEVAGKELEETDATLAYATLKSPFSGVVVERHVDPGDLVRNIQAAADSPQRPLFAVARLDTVRVSIAVPENEAPWADEGDAVTVVVRAIPGRVFRGKIDRVARRLDESTRTMTAEVDLANPDHVLLPGMYAEATIELDKKENALMLPAGAVRYDEEGHAQVYVVDPGDVVRVVDVSTGLDDGKQIEILSGLDENARVIDAMVGRLAPGQRVRVRAD